MILILVYCLFVLGLPRITMDQKMLNDIEFELSSTVFLWTTNMSIGTIVNRNARMFTYASRANLSMTMVTVCTETFTEIS